MSPDDPFDYSNLIDVGTTDQQMLEQAQQGEDLSWKTMVRQYGPMIYQIARRFGLQPADAGDLVQTVLMELMRSLTKFEREQKGSFRRWLKIITRNKIIDYQRRRDQQGVGFLDEHIASVLPEQEPEVFYPTELQLRLQEVIDTVRKTVSETTWEAFELMQLGMETSEQIGARLGISADAVRMAKRRVLIQIKLLLEKTKNGE